jgi:hypothetical protein
VPSTRAGSLVSTASARVRPHAAFLAPFERQAQQQLQPGGAGLGLGKRQGLGVFVHRRVVGHQRVDGAVGQASRSASRSRCWRSGGFRRARLSK